MNTELKNTFASYNKELDSYESLNAEELKNCMPALSLAFNMNLDAIAGSADLEACLALNKTLHRLKLLIMRAEDIPQSIETEDSQAVSKEGRELIWNVIHKMEQSPSRIWLVYMYERLMDALTYITILERSDDMVRMLHVIKRLLLEHFPAEDCSR